MATNALQSLFTPAAGASLSRFGTTGKSLLDNPIVAGLADFLGGAYGAYTQGGGSTAIPGMVAAVQGMRQRNYLNSLMQQQAQQQAGERGDNVAMYGSVFGPGYQGYKEPTQFGFDGAREGFGVQSMNQNLNAGPDTPLNFDPRGKYDPNMWQNLFKRVGDAATTSGYMQDAPGLVKSGQGMNQVSPISFVTKPQQGQTTSLSPTSMSSTNPIPGIARNAGPQPAWTPQQQNIIQRANELGFNPATALAFVDQYPGADPAKQIRLVDKLAGWQKREGAINPVLSRTAQRSGFNPAELINAIASKAKQYQPFVSFVSKPQTRQNNTDAVLDSTGKVVAPLQASAQETVPPVANVLYRPVYTPADINTAMGAGLDNAAKAGEVRQQAYNTQLEQQVEANKPHSISMADLWHQMMANGQVSTQQFVQSQMAATDPVKAIMSQILGRTLNNPPAERVATPAEQQQAWNPAPFRDVNGVGMFGQGLSGISFIGPPENPKLTTGTLDSAVKRQIEQELLTNRSKRR